MNGYSPAARPLAKNTKTRPLGLRSFKARLDAAQRRLDELEAGTRQERIDAQAAIVAQLKASLTNVGVDIEESTLRAPFSGMIGRRFHDEGTIVSTGSPLFRIVEDQRLEAWIGLPAELAASQRDRGEVKLQIARRPRSATLKTVLPELDPATRTRMGHLPTFGDRGRSSGAGGTCRSRRAD